MVFQIGILHQDSEDGLFNPEAEEPDPDLEPGFPLRETQGVANSSMDSRPSDDRLLGDRVGGVGWIDLRHSRRSVPFISP